MAFQYRPAGDLSILVEMGERIDEETNAKVTSLASLVEADQDTGFGEVILGYTSLLVRYNPLKLTYEEAESQLRRWEEQIRDQKPSRSRMIEIPTLYGGEWGPDLDDVAEHNGLSRDEVIAIHSGSRYLVYFIGFTPGFPFLGGMSEKIATPRLSSPRVSIPAGSVGIANNQTGMYPVASPGGWRLIGRTPLKLYAPEKEHPFLLQPGDYVTFKKIDETEFEEILAEVEEGTYESVISRSGEHEGI